MRRARWVVLFFGVVMLLTACAAGANPAADVPTAEGEVAGFWLGLWHGVIMPITFDVGIYEVHNNGGWYNFGFVLGAGVLLSGGGAGAGVGARR